MEDYDCWWDAEKMLNLYLHDYLAKKNMHQTAAIFRNEAHVSDNPVAIDSPVGFLHEWWSIFYDVYASRKPPGFEAEASFKGVQFTEVQLQNLNRLAARALINHQMTAQFSISSDSAYRDFDPNSLRTNVHKPNFLMPFATTSSHVQQQISDLALQQVIMEHTNNNDRGRTVRVDGQLYRDRKALVPVTRHLVAGIHERANTMPLNGCPLDVLNSHFHTPYDHKQFRMLMPKRPEVPAPRSPRIPRNLKSGFDGSSAEYNFHNLMPPNINESMYKPQIVQMGQTPDWQKKRSELQNASKRMKLTHQKAVDRISEHTKVEDDKSVTENIESFLWHEDDHVSNRGNPFENLIQRSSTSSKSKKKGFTFQEIGSLQSHKGKVQCCHFSSDGKLLATAGYEKAFIWNMNALDILSTLEQHSHLITDIRFKPSSTIFATSSSDKSVQIWDAASPSRSHFKLIGHAEQVMSLDFHPTKADILCSCDANDAIRLWNVKQCSCLHILKGATKQVRFQPQLGKLVATASGNHVNVIDVETCSLLFSLGGHKREVLSICWDPSGKYIASLSEDAARLWSVSSQECSGELLSNGCNKFQSCTFHPGFPQILIIGGYQSLELWNPTESSKTWTVEAHKGLVSSLTDSPQTEMVASASHDQCVKLWK